MKGGWLQAPGRGRAQGSWPSVHPRTPHAHNLLGACHTVLPPLLLALRAAWNTEAVHRSRDFKGLGCYHSSGWSPVGPFASPGPGAIALFAQACLTSWVSGTSGFCIMKDVSKLKTKQKNENRLDALRQGNK